MSAYYTVEGLVGSEVVRAEYEDPGSYQVACAEFGRLKDMLGDEGDYVELVDHCGVYTSEVHRWYLRKDPETGELRLVESY